MNRRSISESFIAAKRKRGIALAPFLPAGYPDLQTTAAALGQLESAGADLIEIGIPFSDPIADGPTIQEAFTAALAKKLKVHEVFEMVASERPRLSIPLLAMVSYSVVYRFGLAKFVEVARSSGFDGLILPDVPPPEAERVCEMVRGGGLETILLVAPTTTPQRRREIARLSSGFVYYLSVSGITGERAELPADLRQGVQQLKQLTDRPVCVGFGISRPHHLTQLRGLADGAIVGSAYVKHIKAVLNDGPVAIAARIAAYTRELLSEVEAIK